MVRGHLRAPDGPSRPVSRVLYPACAAGPMTIYLVPRLPVGSSNQPEDLGRAASTSSYLVLLLAGFAQPAGHPAAGELLPHLFTLTPVEPGRFGLCGTFRRVSPPGRYPAPCPAEPGLSSPRSRHGAATRPANPLLSLELNCTQVNL